MSLAVNAETFDCCIIHTSIKWNIELISSVLDELKVVSVNRLVTRSKWIDVASRRMTLTESEGYWSLFMETRSSLLGLTGDWIDFPTLGILLLCQCYPNVRVRAESSNRSEALVQSLSTTAVIQIAQSQSVSPVSRNRHVLINLPKILRDNSSILQFIVEHIPHYVDMLTNDISKVADFEISREQLERLEILLIPTTGRSVADILLSGQSSITASALKSALIKRIYWDDTLFPPQEINNGPSYLSAPPSVRNNILISNQSRKSILRDEPSDEVIKSLYLINCTETTVFVAGIIQNAVIIGCSDCEVVLLATTGTLILSHCDKVTIRSVASSVRLENSTECTACVYTTRGIILTGDTRGVQLSPFNVTYSLHSAVLAKAGLHPDSSHATLWSQPLCLTLSDSPYVLVSPERFRLISFPEFSPAEKQDLAVCLPQLYADGLARKIASLETLRSEINLIDDASAMKMNAIISGHFREWISANNKTRALMDLVKLRSMS